VEEWTEGMVNDGSCVLLSAGLNRQGWNDKLWEGRPRKESGIGVGSGGALQIKLEEMENTPGERVMERLDPEVLNREFGEKGKRRESEDSPPPSQLRVQEGVASEQSKPYTCRKRDVTWGLRAKLK